MAACKARDTITSVSASEIKPFESRNEDPQVIAGARAVRRLVRRPHSRSATSRGHHCWGTAHRH
eukprot:7155826-Pyramimonas_sp.AAC.1